MYKEKSVYTIRAQNENSGADSGYAVKTIEERGGVTFT
jgi:hypothetical protein